MAKKKMENIVITDKELTPTIIGKLDTKQKSPILLIFIFIVFIAVAIFLPDITGYIENYLNGTNKIPQTPVVNNKPEEENNEQQEPEQELEPEQNEIVYYDFSEGLNIELEDFNITNIEKIDGSIKFDIINNKDEDLVLDNTKYFIELYSEDITLLQRIKISYGILKGKETKNYVYEIDGEVVDNVNKFRVVEKTVEDYPEINLSVGNDGNSKLTCIKGYSTITYTFVNNELISINELVKYPFSNDLSYSGALQSYQIAAANYNNYDGVTSTIISNQTGFAFTTLINSQTADTSALNNNDYYSYRTLAKVIKFETESNGYSCN